MSKSGNATIVFDGIEFEVTQEQARRFNTIGAKVTVRFSHTRLAIPDKKFSVAGPFMSNYTKLVGDDGSLMVAYWVDVESALAADSVIPASKVG